MKNLSINHLNDCVHSKERTDSRLQSVVVEEILSLTYPEFQKKIPLQREELYQVIFDYFFNDKDAMFYEIENSSNLITACNLKGYKVIIQQNNLTSFSDFDYYMKRKKAKSFHALNQSLTKHEVLNDLEKEKIVGGKKQKGLSSFPLNIYFHQQSRTA